MNFLAGELSEPDGGAVSDAKIPVSPNRHGRIISHRTYLPLLRKFLHLTPVVSSFLSSVEVTVVLLLYNVFRSVLSSFRLNLLLCKYPSLIYRQYLKEPFIRVFSSYFRQVPSMIFTARS